jgi:ribosome recycling factor
MALNFGDFDTKCKKTLEHFKKELHHVRTGRASTGLLDGIHVDYYGSSVPLIQLGMINAPEPRMITIQVYDTNAVEAVEKAIQKSNLGLNPSRDGSLVRLVIPPLTEERRKDLIKGLHKMAEETRVTIRNHRHEVIDDVKKKVKAKQASEDDQRRGETEVQKITDKAMKEIDQMVATKEKEMMEV